jgi:MFS superfamily sulfate permease-like transporter
MTTMLVPVGIAYAEASGLPGITGLYATIVPLLAYALLAQAAFSSSGRIPRLPR